MNQTLRPNKSELKFLNLAYDRFYSLQEEIFDDSFWNNDSKYRYSRIKDIFAVYAELLNYEPIIWVIEQLKQKRPPMESEIASKLFKFIRNLITHFPFFDSWDDVCFDKALINWKGKEETIHRFLKAYEETSEVKYRFLEADKKLMTYLSIKFPSTYKLNETIYLKDILSEKDGVKFSVIMMKQVLDTQVESIK
jgi:predicted metallopeptidase